MPTIEPYIIEHDNGPRLCSYSAIDPLSTEPRCYAALILNTSQGPQYLCKLHSAIELAADKMLLAHAVIDLAI